MMKQHETTKGKKQQQYVYPEFVNIEIEQGKIIKMKYKELIAHEKYIIEDNIDYGFVHDYDDDKIRKYEEKALEELRELKKEIRTNPDVILVQNQETERYEVKK